MNNITKRHALERMINYRMILKAPDMNTLSALSSYMEIPISCVRADFAALASNKVFYLDFENIDENSGFDTEEDLSDIILSGELDETPFELGTDATTYTYDCDYYDSMDDNIFISVTQDEYLAYNNLFEQQTLPKRADKENSFVSTTIRNKKFAYDLNPHILELLDAVEQAIDAGLCIKFNYRPLGLNPSIETVKPVKIGFDATESRYIILCANKDGSPATFEFEYIIGAIKPAPDNRFQLNPYILSNTDKVWGFEYDKCLNKSGKPAKPTRVKLCFYDEANVINKVKCDLAFRNPLLLETTENNELIYEDDVFGIDSFLNWVFSFGSSAKVLSPNSLVKEVVKKIKAYQESCADE